MKDKIIEESVIPPDIELTKKHSCAPSESSYAKEYSQRMSLYFSDAQKTIDTKLRIQQSEVIRSSIHSLSSRLQLKIINESVNKEVLILLAEWGSFSMKIKILNIQGANTKHICEHGRGAYGSIYRGNYNGEIFIVKCLPLQFKDSRFRAVKEWFLMKLAFLTGTGPKLHPYFGFDILMFSECVEFAMEECKKVTVHNSRLDAFYDNLAVLHQLHIVHQDIKPENIMYSPSHDRPVFIDFGLSRIISEEIGKNTLTNFIGTVDFWGPEMARRYIQKKPGPVDLYYNDLFGLQKTIEAFKTLQQSFMEQGGYFQQIQNDGKFEYLTLILGKFFLYSRDFQSFQDLFIKIKEQTDEQFINFFQMQILLFFEELSPTFETKIYFNYFVKEKYKQTSLYLKLYILYEITDKNVCSLEIFKNEDKYQYYQKLCQQITFQCDYSYQSVAKKIKKQKQLMLDMETIKKTSFSIYLRYYLEFISYMRNIHNVSAEERIKAVQVYHSVFIKQNHEFLHHKQLVGSTILHALNWCLSQPQSSPLIDELPYLFFNIYNFLNVLDLGTQSQFINWLNDILNHHSLTATYKKIFVIWVDQSSFMNTIRIVSKDDMPRYYFKKSIQKWVQEQKKILFDGSSRFHKEQLQNEAKKLPYLFQSYFSDEAVKLGFFDSWKNVNIRKDNELLRLYYSLLQSNRQNLMNILPQIFRNSPHYRENSNLCNQIQNIFRQCLRDETLMKQFSFYLESQLILDKVLYRPDYIMTQDDLRLINQELKNVKTQDFSFIRMSLSKIWNKVQKMQFLQNNNLKFLYENQGFILRFFQCEKIRFIQNSNINSKHNCKQCIQHYQLLFLSNKFSAEIKAQAYQLVRKQSKQMMKCLKCSKIQNIIYINHELLQCFNLYFFSEKESVRRATALTQFFTKYIQFVRWTQKQQLSETQTNLVEYGLRFGELMCATQPLLEKKYGGIYNYCLFVIKYHKCHAYFINPQLQLRLRIVLQKLRDNYFSIFAFFLLQISQVLIATQISRWYSTFQSQFFLIMYPGRQIILKDLFEKVKTVHHQTRKINSQRKSYISLISVCFFLLSHQEDSLFKQSLFLTLRNISQLSFQFRRKTIINIYDTVLCSSLCQISRRKRIKYRNFLVKLLIIDGQTVPGPPQIFKGNIFRRMLKEKMSKFQIWKRIDPPLKFSNKDAIIRRRQNV